MLIANFTKQLHSFDLNVNFQAESDVVGITMPVTKWNYQTTHAEEIPDAIAKAFHIALTGRPGPVLLDIAKDAQFAQFDFEYKKCTKIRSYLPEYPVDPFQVKAAADIINEAKKPIVLFGHGVIIAHAEDELKEFIEKTGSADFPGW